MEPVQFQIFYKNGIDSDITFVPVAGKCFEKTSLFPSIETMTDIS